MFAAATSNPGGSTVQRADANGRTVAQLIVDHAAAANVTAGPGPGSIGVVVGATVVQPPDVSALKHLRGWAGRRGASCCQRCRARFCGLAPA